MQLSLMTEDINDNSIKEQTPGSLLTNISTPISLRTTTNDSRNIANVTTYWNDENKYSTTLSASKPASTCLRSNSPTIHCFDDSTDVPFMLDYMTETQLSAFMLTKYEELLPTKQSYYRRMNLVQRIEQLLNTEWPNKDIKAILFGSSVNDLGTNQSDVDICITTQWSGLRNIGTLAKLFIRCGMQQVVCVPRAQVPIVRLFDPETQLACDININSTMALHNTKMIGTYIAIDPRVRPLAMIIKHWAKQRKLNDAADGGTLSTYTWTCMIINFLQMRQPPILPVLHQMKNVDNTDEMFCSDIENLQGFGQANLESLGGLLFAFFRRYSIEFDYDYQVVSVRHGRYLTKQEKGWHFGRNKTSLCVEEPFNVGRNLGNSADARSVRGIRMELNRALEMLVAGIPLNLICSPYRPLTYGAFAPIYGTPNKYYSVILPEYDTNGNSITASSYYSGYPRKTGYSPHSATEWVIPPPPLSLSSTSTSSSSSSSPPLSLSLSSPPSSPSPPPLILLSPNHQPGHRSPIQQQRIIDAISAKYITNDIQQKQQHYYQHTRRQARQHQPSYETRKKNEPPSRYHATSTHHTNSTIEYPTIHRQHSPKSKTTPPRRKSKTSKQVQQQRRQLRRLSAVSTTKDELMPSLGPSTIPLSPTLPRAIEIKLPSVISSLHTSSLA